MRNVANRHGFSEIQMPTFEDLELFTRKSGPGIVDELYAFKDKGGRDIALRPEMTAQVMRFYVSDLSTRPKPLKICYFGPCFRYENPQAGRFREFFQFGAEMIGSQTPETDAEVITLAVSQLKVIGLKGFIVRIGHIGIFRDLLKQFKFSDEEIVDALHHLDKDNADEFKKCAQRKTVPAETIDQILSMRKLKGGIDVLDSVESESAKSYLREVTEYLSALGVKDWQIDLGIIRGLDYYSGLVFEIDAPNLGAEKQICGGGSYHLVPLFGGEEVFTTGFASGFDRILIALENEGWKHEEKPLDVYVLSIGDGTRKQALEITHRIRRSGLSADFDSMRRSLSKGLKYASLISAKKTIIVGEKELSNGIVTVRDMASGDQLEVKIEKIEESLKS